VVDCLVEIQKLYDQDQYRVAIKGAKEQAIPDKPPVQSQPPLQQAQLPQPVEQVEEVTQREQAQKTQEEKEQAWKTQESAATAISKAEGEAEAEAALRKKLKFIPGLAIACQEWVEGVVGIMSPGAIEHFEQWLRSGVILCKLINAIVPGSVASIYEGPKAFNQRENISKYCLAVRNLGIPGPDMFDTTDLFEGKNFNMVLTNLNALANLCQTLPGYTGPIIQDTSKAKNLYGDSLLGNIISVDEDKEEAFSPEEQEVVNWANQGLLMPSRSPSVTSFEEKPIKNLNSLRTGVKIIRLMAAFLPSLNGEWVSNPSTILDFLTNSDYILANLQGIHLTKVPGVASQQIASGEKEAILRLLSFIREKHDENALFLS